MKAKNLRFALTIIALYLSFIAVAQNKSNDDIYTNKNPGDYYDDKSQRYDEDGVDDDDYTDERRLADKNGFGEEENYKLNDEEGKSYNREDDYVCRPGHHYHCRHDRYYKRYRHYWFPGGSVVVNSGRHGYVHAKVWVPGHWEYSYRGHRYRVPGRYRYERVKW